MTEKDSHVILVIDDSNTNVVLLDAILSEQGYRVQSALSVKEALQIMERELPDLILLDLLMPKVNGYEFLKELKRNEKTKHIPVIVVTAVTEQENLQQTLDLGAESFIIKPIDIQSVIEKVDKVFHP